MRSIVVVETRFRASCEDEYLELKSSEKLK